MERTESGNEINVLDGVALVMGSAIASVHILRIMRSGLTAAGWVMVCLAFAWVALTAAGPVHLPGPAVREPAPRLSQDRRSALGLSGASLAPHGHHPVGSSR